MQKTVTEILQFEMIRILNYKTAVIQIHMKKKITGKYKREHTYNHFGFHLV